MLDLSRRACMLLTMTYRLTDSEIHLPEGCVLVNIGTWRYITEATPEAVTPRALRAMIVRLNERYLDKVPHSRHGAMLRDAVRNEIARLGGR